MDWFAHPSPSHPPSSPPPPHLPTPSSSLLYWPASLVEVKERKRRDKGGRLRKKTSEEMIVKLPKVYVWALTLLFCCCTISSSSLNFLWIVYLSLSLAFSLSHAHLHTLRSPGAEKLGGQGCSSPPSLNFKVGDCAPQLSTYSACSLETRVTFSHSDHYHYLSFSCFLSPSPSPSSSLPLSESQR